MGPLLWKSFCLSCLHDIETRSLSSQIGILYLFPVLHKKCFSSRIVMLAVVVQDCSSEFLEALVQGIHWTASLRLANSSHIDETFLLHRTRKWQCFLLLENSFTEICILTRPTLLKPKVNNVFVHYFCGFCFQRVPLENMNIIIVCV